MKIKIKKALVAIGVALGLVLTSGCGALIKTDQQTQALWYEDGDFQAQVFKGCIKSATRERHGLGDTYYRYPIGDRTWSFTGRPGSDAGPITIKTRDSQEMSVVGFMQFTLTDNCEILRTFHERIGLKYGAYFPDGESVSDGWISFLNDYIAVPVNTVMDRGGLQHEVRSLYANSEVTSTSCDVAQKAALKCGAQDAFKQYVQANAQGEIDRVLGIKDFLKVKLVAAESPQPSAELLDSFKKVEQGKAEAEATRSKAEADGTAQAAKNRLAKQKYQEIRECVAVLGQEACFRLELQKGPNPPQYIPDGSDLLVQEK
jgi:hypothetical protein